MTPLAKLEEDFFNEPTRYLDGHKATANVQYHTSKHSLCQAFLSGGSNSKYDFGDAVAFHECRLTGLDSQQKTSLKWRGL